MSNIIDKDYSGINPESIPIPENYWVNRLQNYKEIAFKKAYCITNIIPNCSLHQVVRKQIGLV